MDEEQGHRCSVVLCDDRQDFRELLHAMLSRVAELEIVGEAENGAEAIEIARRLQPDIMLLDLSMPVLDGMTALPEIRTASPDTRVLVLTGYTSEAISRRAHEAGATAFLEKGMRPALLVDAVRSACKAA